MTQEIKIINFGTIKGYLVKTDTGYILIDTGHPSKRISLEKELKNAGCTPGNLKLVILTHGDIDHSGNAAYLREKFGAKIVMHQDDLIMVEYGAMSWNRKAKSDKISIIFKIMPLISFFVKPNKLDKFKPDLTVNEGYDLSTYGFDAEVLHIPGHSKGSIGILTTSGKLFCGDLLYNMGMGLSFTPYTDDLADFNTSVEKLKKLNIKTVYPGHGKPFPLEKFLKNHDKVKVNDYVD